MYLNWAFVFAFYSWFTAPSRHFKWNLNKLGLKVTLTEFKKKKSFCGCYCVSVLFIVVVFFGVWIYDCACVCVWFSKTFVYICWAVGIFPWRSWGWGSFSAITIRFLLFKLLFTIATRLVNCVGVFQDLAVVVGQACAEDTWNFFHGNVSLCWPVCLFVWLLVCWLVCLFVWLPVWLFAYLPVNLPASTNNAPNAQRLDG